LVFGKEDSTGICDGGLEDGEFRRRRLRDDDEIIEGDGIGEESGDDLIFNKRFS
jgi:hypothetical protein